MGRAGWLFSPPTSLWLNHESSTGLIGLTRWKRIKNLTISALTCSYDCCNCCNLVNLVNPVYCTFLILYMTRRRFYAPPSAFNSNLEGVTLASDEARHLRDVLRLKTGDEVYVFDGAGKEFHCRIAGTRPDSAHLNVISEVAPARPESALQVDARSCFAQRREI